MKTNAKILSSFLILLMLFGMIPQSAVFAVNSVSGSDIVTMAKGQDNPDIIPTVSDHITSFQHGISFSVETDKDRYESGNEINVSITLKNNNDYIVSDAAVTVQLPEELSLVSGDLSNSGLILKPGDTYHTSVKAMRTAPIEPTKATESTKATQVTKATESTKATETTKATKSTKATEPTMGTQPTKSTPPTKTTQPAKRTQPTKTTDSDDPLAPDEPLNPDDPLSPDDPEQIDPSDPTLPTQKSGTLSSSDQEKKTDENLPDKTDGMSVKTIVLVVFHILVIAGLALIAFRKHKNISKRAICLLLFLAIGFGLAPIDVYGAKSEKSDTPALKTDSANTDHISISAKKSIRIDGKEYVIKAEFSGVQTKNVTNYRYLENKDGTITLTGYNGSESKLVIPASIGGKPVSAIGDSAFAGLLCLQTVRVPEGVRHIGNYAFECCSLLKKIYLPDSLLSIGDGAFSGCGCLTLADMQDGIESIGKGAFLCCDSLVQLELPGTLKELGDFAFAGCEVLTSVRMSCDHITSLPDRVFYGCSSLTNPVLPPKITSIGKRAFSGCEKIESLYFSEPLTALGAYAFNDCSKLNSLFFNAKIIPTGILSGCYGLSGFSVQDGATRIEKGAFSSSGISDIEIPASVKMIEPGAFYPFHGHITLSEENRNYQLIDGSLYTADGKTLVAFFPADPYSEDPQTEFTVPDGVETIASYAIAETSLTTVTLPSSLKHINVYAFQSTQVENMTIPEEVEVDPAAFGNSEQDDESSDDSGDTEVTLEVGSVAGDKNLFREENYANFREIKNDEFDAWCDKYLAYNEAQGIPLRLETIPYIYRYKGEIVSHFIPMTAVQNRDPNMWAKAATIFGDDFEQTYLMMDHGLFTELSRGKIEEPLVLYSGLYDSQLMAAAGTDVVPTQQQLADAIGKTFTDPIMISTTTDPGIAAGFGDTLFIIYASPEAMERLGAVCIDAVVRSQEKEILMNFNAQYRILDVGNMAIEQQNPWNSETETLYRHYVKVELVVPE